MESLLPKELISLEPWDRLPNESDLDFDRFMSYLQLGPERSLIGAHREYLIRHGKLMPGEPTPAMPPLWNGVCSKHAWNKRCKAYDEYRWTTMKATAEDLARDRVKIMVKEHVEGAQLFRKAAVNGMFRKDEAGNIICDPETGEPLVIDIDDPGIAMRLFRQAVNIERTASNLPAEILGMSTAKIEERIIVLRQELGALDEPIESNEDIDVVEGDFEELDGDSGSASEG